MILVLLPACLPLACGGASALPSVLRESEELVHLPRGTRLVPPDSPAFEVARPEGAWLVDAGYLARIHELLGLGATRRTPSADR